MLRKLLAQFIGIFSAGARAHDYQAGQIWQYRTRSDEEKSRLYIVKVETLASGERAFHVYLDNLKVANKNLAGGVQTEIPHVPVSSKTLDLSVIALQGSTGELPDISEGYDVWREAYDAGEGGIFTVPVSQIIEIIEGMVGQHLGTHP